MTRSRSRTLASFLWLSAFGWAIGLGAKVFDLVVLGVAWGWAPPESLALMPYGRSYPVDPGTFFQPLSAILLIGLVGAFVAGWHQRRVRGWLCVTAASLTAIWICTPTVFWPMIVELWETSRGRQVHSLVDLQALIRRWFVLDTVRILAIAIGFLSIVQAMMPQGRKPIDER